MIALDTRSRDILLIQLRSSVPLSAKEIAKNLGLTTKMVHYCLKEIQVWLEIRGIALKKIPGTGILIDVPDSVKVSLVSELENLAGFSLVLSPQERMHFLILSLFSQEQPLLLKQMALVLGVSRPTVLKDMDRVEEWLNAREILLIRRPGLGFKVSGTEWHYRKAIEDLILDAVGVMSILALCQGRQSKLISQLDEKIRFMRMASLSLEQLDLAYCGELVEIMEGMSHFQYSDSSYISLLLYLAILVDRVKKGSSIALPSIELDDIEVEKEYQIANVVASLIHHQYGVNLKPDETVYIAIRLMGIKQRQTISIIKDGSNILEDHAELDVIVKDMILEASKLLHPYLNVDQQLSRGLSIHIKPVINRLRYDQSIRNPLLGEIKNQYPYIYNVAKQSCRILETKIGRRIPEEEIGYVAMHFGAAMERLRSHSPLKKRVYVVCGGGCATAWMLVSRLQAELPEIDVVEVMSALEITKYGLSLQEIDAIITVVPLEMKSPPVILVSPFLSELDKESIQATLKVEAAPLVSQDTLDSETGFSLGSLITDRTVQPQIHAPTWQAVVDKACLPLMQVGHIDESYVSAIKGLLEKHGPYMVLSPGIVVLHAMVGVGVHRVCMSLSTFIEPVNFGNPYNDPVSIAFVFGAVDYRSHLKALAQLSRLLGDRDAIDSIKRATTKSEILQIIQFQSGNDGTLASS
jgi:transcriptional antiterminator